MFYIFVEETDEGASGSSDYKEGVCLIFTFVCLFSWLLSLFVVLTDRVLL